MIDINISDVRVHPGDSGFLVDDGETSILYDSGFAFTGEGMVGKIKEQIGDRKLDFIFLTHSHYDHFSEEDILKVKNEKTKNPIPIDITLIPLIIPIKGEIESPTS